MKHVSLYIQAAIVGVFLGIIKAGIIGCAEMGLSFMLGVSFRPNAWYQIVIVIAFIILYGLHAIVSMRRTIVKNEKSESVGNR